MKASEITEKVTAKEPFFKPRWKRMDDDFEIWKNKGGEDKGTVGTKTKEHTNDIEIISNEPRRSCDDVISILASASRQIMVRMAETEQGEDREEVSKLERLLTFAFDKADERLRRQVLLPFREAALWHSGIRGGPAARILVYKQGKNVIFDFLNLDPRQLVYEVGADGFLWVAYKIFKSKALLLDEHGFKASKEKDNEVLDWWKFEEEGKMTNAVICDNKFVKNEEIVEIPSMPFVIAPVPTRPPVAGDDGAGYGESLLAPIRGINAIRNRFASIVASHAALMANQALINYKAEGGATVPSTTNVPGGVIELVMGKNRLEPSPMKEISPTVTSMLGWLSDQVESGLLPKIPINQPPVKSGTLYSLAQEAGNKIFNPQLRNLSYFYQDICRLMEEQLVAGGIKVKVKTELKSKYYEAEVKPIDIKKPHIIKVEFIAQTPWTQLDTYQVADMAKRLGVPEGYIWEYILKFPDPKGLQDLSAIEMFEHSPIGAMKRAVEALMKRGGEGDAEAAQSLVKMMNAVEAEQATQEGTPPPAVEELPPQGV